MVISHFHLMLLFYALSLIKQCNAFWHARDLMTAGKSVFLLLPDRKALCPEQRPLSGSRATRPWFPQPPSSCEWHPLALERRNHTLRQEGSWQCSWTCHLLLSTSPKNILLHEYGLVSGFAPLSTVSGKWKSCLQQKQLAEFGSLGKDSWQGFFPVVEFHS